MTTDESRTRCPVCGTELHTGANFCYACGENMRTKEEPTTDETVIVDHQDPDSDAFRSGQSKRRRWEWWKR